MSGSQPDSSYGGLFKGFVVVFRERTTLPERLLR